MTADVGYFERLRQPRKIAPFDLGDGTSVLLQPLNTFHKWQLDDLMDDLRKRGVGDKEIGFRVAVFLVHLGVVNAAGEPIFESTEHVLKVFGDIGEENLGNVFPIAEEIADRSGIRRKSSETAEKN